MIESEDYWDFIISTSEELKDASEMEDQKQRGNLKIEGIFIGDKESYYLAGVIGGLDPKVILFNKCKLQLNSFQGNFCGPIGVESVLVLNSNLTSLLSYELLSNVAGESLKYLDLSHNNLAENADEFFTRFTSLKCFFCSLEYIDLSDNGFNEEEIKKIAKYVHKNWKNLTIKF
ncbi:hypothetical protein M9Y10_040624 [Tritrichomonas musculus]|uniref:Leucine Rich Repeat family protein n=1 Tax=Tritrichomonas musculus TaxID=1915356 RepID=A0ABR2GPC7_9EUKA